MEVQYIQLIKIDHENNDVSPEELGEEGNVRDYVMDMVENIADNVGDREYEYKEGEETMKGYVDSFITGENRELITVLIANRLLNKESDAQIRYAHITEIQKGIMLIAFCWMADDQYKVVISKADYTEFIEEATGQKKNGLPTKKKIFKSYVANVTLRDRLYNITKIVTYDVNAKQAKYWYEDFLDLKAKLDDKANTKRAFEVIRSQILEPLRKNYKRDFLCLWNSTVRYMRSEGQFSVDYYTTNILGDYHPFDERLNITALQTKALALPDKFKFDRVFTKVPQEIKTKIKTELKLSDDMTLLIKEGLANLDSVILPELDNEGNKYIMIRSEEGYAYANNIRNRESTD